MKVTKADLLAMLLIRLARMRGKAPDLFVLTLMAKHWPDITMLDDLTADQLDAGIRQAKASIKKEAAKAAKV
jgi:hypothetical protein